MACGHEDKGWEHLLQTQAERVGVILSGEEKAPGTPGDLLVPKRGLPVLKRGLQESRGGTFCQRAQCQDKE